MTTCGPRCRSARRSGRCARIGSGPRTLRLRAKLDFNESPFDVPEEIRAEVLGRIAAKRWGRYPEFGAPRLKKAIAEAIDRQPEEIVVGNGSGEVLLAAVSVFAGGGLSGPSDAHLLALRTDRGDRGPRASRSRANGFEDFASPRRRSSRRRRSRAPFPSSARRTTRRAASCGGNSWSGCWRPPPSCSSIRPTWTSRGPATTPFRSSTPARTSSSSGRFRRRTRPQDSGSDTRSRRRSSPGRSRRPSCRSASTSRPRSWPSPFSHPEISREHVTRIVAERERGRRRASHRRRTVAPSRSNFLFVRPRTAMPRACAARSSTGESSCAT